MRILLVEDDVMLGDGMVDALRSSGYTVDWLQQGLPALSALKSEEFAALILDLNLPDIDGISLLRKLRREGQTLPVLILTARDALDDRVLGLELGADDYIVKPFEPRELIARVRSILRRYPGQPELPADPAKRVAEFAGWRFAPGSNTLTSPSGQEETLSTAEAQLLSVLLAHPNHILTREQLLGGRDVAALDRSIDLRISRLRRRLEENPQHARLIKTVYGAGYLLAATVTWS